MIDESLDRQILLGLSLLRRRNFLRVLEQLAVILALRFLELGQIVFVVEVKVLFAGDLFQDQIDLLIDTKFLVFSVEVLLVLFRVFLLTLDNATHLYLVFLFSINRVLGLDPCFELLNLLEIILVHFSLGLLHLILQNEVVDLAVVSLNFFFLHLVLCMQALIDDGLDLGSDVQVAQNFINRTNQIRLLVKLGRQHFHQNASIAVQHLGLDLQVEVDILLAKARELELLDVDLDAEVSNVQVT